MSDAELFLLAWAVIATVVAGLYANKSRNMGEALGAMMFALKEVAKGNAEVSCTDDTLRIKRLKD